MKNKENWFCISFECLEYASCTAELWSLLGYREQPDKRGLQQSGLDKIKAQMKM